MGGKVVSRSKSRDSMDVNVTYLTEREKMSSISFLYDKDRGIVGAYSAGPRGLAGSSIAMCIYSDIPLAACYSKKHDKIFPTVSVP
jgi:hypothetical protein